MALETTDMPFSNSWYAVLKQFIWFSKQLAVPSIWLAILKTTGSLFKTGGMPFTDS
jgi:hypothetical protein